MEVLGYIALFVVGLVLGTLGGGGSILSVPILVYLFSVDTVMASAYSLFIVGTTSLVGTWLKHNAQLVNLRTGVIFGVPSLLSIFCTRRWFVPALPDVIFQTESLLLTKRALILGVFAILMILASVAIIRKKDRSHLVGEQHPSALLILVGLFTGFLTGLVGAGGGFLIIPALVYFTDIPFKSAVGTTLLIITVNSLMGFMGDVMNYAINWHFLLSITSLAIVGIIVGTRSLVSLPTNILQKAFGWFVMCMGTWILFREIFY
ncbi:MAG: sulfite exporter TauE/SafE family protein [Tunicatimonas sp.]